MLQKGDRNKNLKKILLKSFGNELLLFQRTTWFIRVYGTKHCKDKTLQKKKSMIKDMARASIEERETTSVWSHGLEEIHQDEDISQYIHQTHLKFVKTGSTQVADTLSWLGHCISYYEVNAFETAYVDSQVKGTVKETGKTLIKDQLRILKVS